MEIKNHADFAKFVDLCRKKGVKSVEFQGLKLELRDETPPSNYKKKKELEVQPDYVPVEGVYNDEQALFWSSQADVGVQ